MTIDKARRDVQNENESIEAKKTDLNHIFDSGNIDVLKQPKMNMNILAAQHTTFELLYSLLRL